MSLVGGAPGILSSNPPLCSLQEAEEKTPHCVAINPEHESRPVSGDRDSGDGKEGNREK